MGERGKERLCLIFYLLKFCTGVRCGVIAGEGGASSAGRGSRTGAAAQGDRL